MFSYIVLNSFECVGMSRILVVVCVPDPGRGGGRCQVPALPFVPPAVVAPVGDSRRRDQRRDAGPTPCRRPDRAARFHDGRAAGAQLATLRSSTHSVLSRVFFNSTAMKLSIWFHKILGNLARIGSKREQAQWQLVDYKKS